MPRDPEHYRTEDQGEHQLDHLLYPPPMDQQQLELIKRLQSPGRYPRNTRHAFGNPQDFAEGHLITFQAMAEDAKSAHTYTPKSRQIADVL